MNKKNKFKSKPILIKDWANKDQNHKKKLSNLSKTNFQLMGIIDIKNITNAQKEN